VSTVFSTAHLTVPPCQTTDRTRARANTATGDAHAPPSEESGGRRVLQAGLEQSQLLRFLFGPYCTVGDSRPMKDTMAPPKWISLVNLRHSLDEWRVFRTMGHQRPELPQFHRKAIVTTIHSPLPATPSPAIDTQLPPAPCV
jgi:hypothetical protein